MTDLNDHVHGTVTGYTYWSCRCDACRAAWRVYATEWRHRPEVRYAIAKRARRDRNGTPMPPMHEWIAAHPHPKGAR